MHIHSFAPLQINEAKWSCWRKEKKKKTKKFVVTLRGFGLSMLWLSGALMNDELHTVWPCPLFSPCTCTQYIRHRMRSIPYTIFLLDSPSFQIANSCYVFTSKCDDTTLPKYTYTHTRAQTRTQTQSQICNVLD